MGSYTKPGEGHSQRSLTLKAGPNRYSEDTPSFESLYGKNAGQGTRGVRGLTSGADMRGKGHMGPPSMDKAERGARAEAAEMRMQKANTKAYDAAMGYKNGGMVKTTPKSTPYACGGKVK